MEEMICSGKWRMITASPSQNLTGSMHQTARLDGFREGTFYDMASATNSFARQLHDKLQAQPSHGHNVFSKCLLCHSLGYSKAMHQQWTSPAPMKSTKTNRPAKYLMWEAAIPESRRILMSEINFSSSHLHNNRWNGSVQCIFEF